ncbi:D-2-hydroxyacid dehydrogenase [Candidatus Enterococcus ikei]|uniref:D-2-hydroxyacid dehydrogenase n=1 Tax=Candidatus Enterococcus ikei TaxID=2815326 RepID=A0ABS3GVP8_9ENTE|nr:D-2-hydroxyacid dehydrogenase [Enterococcus sp. DIV0869a]MBO0439336.1 D-2-hydroxyacid dehydrogenase [Enterococcus sp. DIV0869a]
MDIVVLDGYTENPGDLSWSSLEKLGNLTVYDRSPLSEAELVKRIGDAQVVLTNKTPLTKKVIQEAKQLKYIGVLATGYNVVDVIAAKEQGIIVTNIPTYGTDTVAQYTIALLLELAHHIGAHSDSVKRGEWTNSKDWCYWNYPQIELSGKTLGIIGYGRIGQRVGEIAAALGMKVIATNGEREERDRNGTKLVSLEQLFAESDIISLHCPLVPENERIINAENIGKMKTGVLIINDSRGQLINEKDLAQALDSGKVGAAAVDVVSEEPIRAENPLLQAKNIIITPHIAWASKEARSRLMEIAVDNVSAYLNGTPKNRVNK